jgi:catechol 2,3-dioxygenase-like lactoylglutathione lyase family enzyme
MKYKFSGNINFPTAQWKEATEFYKRVFGLSEGSGTDTYSHLESNSFHIYFDSDVSTPGPIFEFYVPDLEAAKQELLANGCSILRWDGHGKPNYVRDPFGFVFNVYEEKP